MQRLTVFVSGRMAELRPERTQLKGALEPFCKVILAEESPDPREPVEKSLEWARESDIYIGVYGESYGHDPPSITHREFREARNHAKPMLIFVKGVPDQRQAEFLQEVQQAATYIPFHTGDELCRQALEGLKHEADRLSQAFQDSFTWLGVRATLTLVALEGRQYEKAVIWYNRLLAHDKPWLKEYILGELAWLYQKSERWDSAEARLKQRIEVFTDLAGLVSGEEVETEAAWFLVELGFIRNDEGDWELEAHEREYRLRKRQDALARCYLQAGRSSMDQGLIEEAISKLNSAIDYSYDEVMRTDAKELKVQAYVELAQRYFRQGQYDDGFLFCDKALSLSQELDNAGLFETLVLVYLDTAQKCFASDRTSDGEHALERALNVGREFGGIELQEQAWARILTLRYDLGIGSLKRGSQAVEERLDCLQRIKTQEEFDYERSLGEGLMEATRSAVDQIKNAREKWEV
jgi:tetratricopeptide (TPR) repeat protein